MIVKVDGTGNVTSSPASRVIAGVRAPKAINCGTGGFNCYGEYRPGEALTLKAKAAPGYAFKRWTGACAGSAATCRVVTRNARTVTAVFEATGTGAAVASLLKPPRLRVRWQSSVGAGTLVVDGSTSLAATARVDMRRPGGGPLATLRLQARRRFVQADAGAPPRYARGRREALSRRVHRRAHRSRVGQAQAAAPDADDRDPGADGRRRPASVPERARRRGRR